MAHHRTWCHTDWDTLLSAWSDEIDNQKRRWNVPNLVIEDQRGFLDAFEQLCRTKRLNNYVNLSQRFHFQHIDVLVRKSDGECRHNPSQSLAALAYTATFISTLCNARGPLGVQGIVDMISGLNHKMPALNSDIWDNFSEEDVQSSLRQMYNRYMVWLVGTITGLDPRNTPSRSNPSNDDIVQRARRMSESLGALGEEFANLLNTAMQSISSASVFTDASYNSVDSGFQYEKELGHGSYGTVARYRERSTGFVYAKKTIKLPPHGSEREALKTRAQQEFVIMNQLQHTHIARVCTASAGEDYFSFYMLPVAEMDLARYLGECTRGSYPENELTDMISWFGCLLQGLKFAHGRRLQHNDIKPSNILVKQERGRWRVWLTDFGLARDLTDISPDAAFSIRGTPIYRAPEVRHGHTPQSKSDVYSLGCVFAEMLSVSCKKSVDEFKIARTKDGNHAFRDNEAAVRAWLERLPVQSIAGGRDLLLVVKQMLVANPHDRWDADRAAMYLRTPQDTRNLFFCGEC